MNKNISKDPSMFDDFVTFADIKLKVDPINRKRSDVSDNVMAIFYEEQPFTWEFVKPYIAEALKKSTGKVDFLDVGTGSGVFSILMAKHFGAKPIALDKSPRAIAQARSNAQLNGVHVDLRQEFYDQNSIEKNSAKVIGLYPPYHLYPQEIENKIPQHARGGSNGQEEFISQLKFASKHLADNGIIFFNQMCLGDNKAPAFTKYTPQIFGKGVSTIYTNVFPPMSTDKFLDGVYPAKEHVGYIDKTTREYPMVYYAVGVICLDGKGITEEASHNIDLRGRSWADRVKLHYEIAQHEYK